MNKLARLSRTPFAGLISTLLILCFVIPGIAVAETIAVIGTGAVAGALGPRFAELDHTVVYGSRNPARDSVRELVARSGHGASATTPAEAAAVAGIVVLAIPGAVVESVTKSLGNLSGKIIIDPTNSLRRRDDGYLEMAVATSNAEIIQAAAPGARVVKAFNCLNARQMAEPESAGGPISIPLAGDDAEAKSVVAGLVEGIGLEPIDVGPLRHARHIEGMLVLWINNRFVTGPAFEYHLWKVEKN